jgi:hypothetical protein
VVILALLDVLGNVGTGFKGLLELVKGFRERGL